MLHEDAEMQGQPQRMADAEFGGSCGPRTDSYHQGLEVSRNESP